MNKPHSFLLALPLFRMILYSAKKKVLRTPLGKLQLKGITSAVNLPLLALFLNCCLAAFALLFPIYLLWRMRYMPP